MPLREFKPTPEQIEEFEWIKTKYKISKLPFLRWDPTDGSIRKACELVLKYFNLEDME